jgi:hypothetical protein
MSTNATPWQAGYDDAQSHKAPDESLLGDEAKAYSRGWLAAMEDMCGEQA